MMPGTGSAAMDLGLMGEMTREQMEEEAKKRKKKLNAATDGNPGNYGDISSPATMALMGPYKGF